MFPYVFPLGWLCFNQRNKEKSPGVGGGGELLRKSSSLTKRRRRFHFPCCVWTLDAQNTWWDAQSDSSHLCLEGRALTTCWEWLTRKSGRAWVLDNTLESPIHAYNATSRTLVKRNNVSELFKQVVLNLGCTWESLSRPKSYPRPMKSDFTM